MSSLKIILAMLGFFLIATIFIYKAAYEAGFEKSQADVKASIIDNKKKQDEALAKLPTNQKDYFKCIKNGQCSL